MDPTPEGFPALLELWSRRYQLSVSQKALLQATADSQADTQDSALPINERLKVSVGELEILEKLFSQRTGRTVQVALDEIGRIAHRRASQRPLASRRV